MITDADPIYFDHSGITTGIDPDWDSIDRNVFQRCEPDAADFDKAAEAIRQVQRWVFQDGPRNPEGLVIRSTIAAWIFLPELRQLNMTSMAAGMGLKKQSLGRWVDVWKRDFPHIRTPHMDSQR